jgi:hypothetical protein
MSEKIIEVQVQGDFLDRLTSARPVQALAELIWNAVDADATDVNITLEQGNLGLDAIIVADNGHGIPYDKAEGLFGSLGGSWKRQRRESQGEKRALHGEEGKGRFRALALGRTAEWNVRTPELNGFLRYSITIIKDNPRRAIISDATTSPKATGTGVVVRIIELHKNWKLDDEKTFQELSEVFALYLTQYPHVAIHFEKRKIDPSVLINHQETYELDPVPPEDADAPPGTGHPATLDVIEWKVSTERMLYLCNEAGFPLHMLSPGIQAPGFEFSAYLKSPYIDALNSSGILALSEHDPRLQDLIQRAKDAMRAHFKSREIEAARSLVDEWKSEKSYPYSSEPVTSVQKLERKVFEIVALNVAAHIPDFQTVDKTGRAIQLRLLRQAIEKSPAELQLILNEVLELPPRRQEELAKLLQRTTLSSIISAAKMVADRLDFIDGVEGILFNEGWKERLKERAQLHKILEDNTWIFGEEFALTVSDKSLTEVLRKHAKAKKLALVIDEPVKRVDDTTGIVDLMLSRSIPGARTEELDHLVVELKAPSVKVGADETTQIKSYAFAVAGDERFRDLSTRWTFWLVANDMNEHAKLEVRTANQPPGMLWQSPDQRITIWVKTWSQILNSSKARLQVFQKELNYSADRDASLDYLKQAYAKVLEGGENKTEVDGKASVMKTKKPK